MDYQEQKKILPINKPFISLYTQHAHLLSILAAHEETYPWIYSNYIQVYYDKNIDWADFYFSLPREIRPSESCSWISTSKIYRNDIIPIWNSIINFIIYYINNDCYVHTMLNYYYISLSRRYQHDHLEHDMLIYGYDVQNKLFYVADFFKDWKYIFETISFAEIETAFLNLKYVTNYDYLNGLTYIYKYNPNCDYNFNKNNIISSIINYMKPYTPEYWNSINSADGNNKVYGCEIYDALTYYLMSKAAILKRFIDVRPFCLLLEHKKMMLRRLEYLLAQNIIPYEKKNLYDKYKNIRDDVFIILSLTLKFQLTADESIINKLAIMLPETCLKENELLMSIFDGISWIN